MIRLLLLSDIHFLTLCREMDPHYPFRKAFLKDLKDYSSEYGAFNHILVCGDIAFKGSKDEYDAAHAFFKDVCQASECKPEEIYVVPGNHDKNYKAPNAELRNIIHSGLSNESASPDELFTSLLSNDFELFKQLYQPFRDYQDFAVKMDSAEPLMTKCLDANDGAPYDNECDKAYLMTYLGEISGYQVYLYALNTALSSDWYDINDSGKGHKLFLPKLSYNAEVETDGCINIVMMHHPLTNVVHGDIIADILNNNFQIQIFGHLHQPASECNNCIQIHSGALQPPKDEGGLTQDYFSIYNILELDVRTNGDREELVVNLRVEKYDDSSHEFIEMLTESREYTLSLRKHHNRWRAEATHTSTSLPEGVSERTVRYRFLQLENPKAIINKLSSYDDNKSHNRNCIDFLNQMQTENRLGELWSLIKK